jgi:hypothetical protein
LNAAIDPTRRISQVDPQALAVQLKAIEGTGASPARPGSN